MEHLLEYEEFTKKDNELQNNLKELVKDLKDIDSDFTHKVVDVKNKSVLIKTEDIELRDDFVDFIVDNKDKYRVEAVKKEGNKSIKLEFYTDKELDKDHKEIEKDKKEKKKQKELMFGIMPPEEEIPTE